MYGQLEKIQETFEILIEDMFIITAYFTDTIKRGDVVWKRK